MFRSSRFHYLMVATCSIAAAAFASSKSFVSDSLAYLAALSYKAFEVVIVVCSKFENFLNLFNRFVLAGLNAPLVALVAAKQYAAHLMTHIGSDWRMYSPN